MAWIEQHRRADGGLTARVIWRPGGARGATRVWETFGAGSDAQNLARADGFKRMVEAAGQRWPDGWVKGEGFVRPPDVADPMTPPPSFDKIGEEYVRQIVDLSPGQRKRYLGQLLVLARTPVRGSLIFAGPIATIGEAQLKTWLIEWDRSLKTKANYHGLIHGVFAYAMKRGYLAANPAIGTAPKQSRVKQSRPELRFLTERELETAVRLAKRHGDVLAFAAGTGLRFGEISALWVGDVDLDRGTVRVNKAWKRNGEDHATEIPGWLSRQLRAKHTMRDHHLGHPKTPRSRRTITIAPAVAALLEKRIEGRPADDFVFTSRTGLPLHNGDFYTRPVLDLGVHGVACGLHRPGSPLRQELDDVLGGLLRHLRGADGDLLRAVQRRLRAGLGAADADRGALTAPDPGHGFRLDGGDRMAVHPQPPRSSAVICRQLPSVKVPASEREQSWRVVSPALLREAFGDYGIADCAALT